MDAADLKAIESEIKNLRLGWKHAPMEDLIAASGALRIARHISAGERVDTIRLYHIREWLDYATDDVMEDEAVDCLNQAWHLINKALNIINKEAE